MGLVGGTGGWSSETDERLEFADMVLFQTSRRVAVFCYGSSPPSALVVVLHGIDSRQHRARWVK